MKSIFGEWQSSSEHGSSTHVLDSNGTFQTHMIFPMGDGCKQHVSHFGRFVAEAGLLRLTFESGKTHMEGCAESAKNFSERDFNDAEIEETRGFLSQAIPFEVDGDTLTTTVEGPDGKMRVNYKRK